MTLIVKELVVRGIVTTNPSSFNNSTFDKESLQQYIEQIKKEIERDCTEKILKKVENKTMR